MSRRSLRRLADALAVQMGESPSAGWGRAPARDRSRAQARVARLAADPDPGVDLLRAWSRPRRHDAVARSVAWSAEEVLGLPGAHRSGISHPWAGMAVAGELEVHLPAASLALLNRAPAGDLRVIAHPAAEWSVGDVVLDLAGHRRAREDAVAVCLLYRARRGRPVRSGPVGRSSEQAGATG